MLKSLIITALVLLANPVLAQDRYNADSLRMVLERTRSDTAKIRLLIEMGDLYKNKTDAQEKNDSANFFLKQAEQLNKKYRIATYQHRLDIFKTQDNFTSNISPRERVLEIIADCKKTGDNKGQMLAWNCLADYDVDHNAYKDALDCFQQCYAIAGQIHDSQSGWNYNRDIANMQIAMGKLAPAEKELLQAIKSKKIQVYSRMYTYDALCFLYIYKGELNKALLYGLNGYQLMQVSRDSSNAYGFMEKIQYVYLILGKYDQALQWGKKNLAHLIASKNRKNLFQCCTKIIMLLNYTGKSAEGLSLLTSISNKYKPNTLDEKRVLQKDFGICYMGVKNYPMAEKSYLEMLKLETQQGNGEQIADKGDDLGHLGYLYVTWKKYDKARFYYLESLKIFEAIRMTGNIENIHRALFSIDSALGNWQSSNKQLLLYYKLKDSLFNISKNKQIEELQIKYQTVQKEKDFKLVQNKEKLDKISLLQGQNTRNWIIGAAGLLLIIAGLLYRQNRLKQKRNDAVNQKNELLQKLVHEEETSNRTIQKKNELLQRLVTEKEWLLKEVHHRVKNNLHSVICLLEAQAANLENDALKAIENSQHRIFAMSLIHQKLYQSEDVTNIDMGVFIPELVQYLSDSFDVADRILFKLKVEPLDLNASQAIPVALIINEALTNSIKYAFPDNRNGEISITLSDLGAQYKLELTDNGIGMPEKMKARENESMGLRLIKGLTKEIKGHVTFRNSKGVKITIIFERDQLNETDILAVDYLTVPPPEHTLL